MKVSRQTQRLYADALRSNDLKSFIELFDLTKEQFIPMHVVSHGYLSSSALNLIQDEIIEKTVKYWNLDYLSGDKTFFCWLYSKHFTETKKFIVLLLKNAVDKLTTNDQVLIINEGILTRSFPLKPFLGKMRKESVEVSGKNYFSWLILYGTLDQIQSEYKPGMEFEEDGHSNKLLALLPQSKQSIRDWMIKNTQILNDPLFTFLGISLTNESYLPKPWHGVVFDINKKSLKEALGVRSKLIVKTLQSNVRFPISKEGYDHQIFIDYFNAVYFIKKELPNIDENVLNNALVSVVNKKYNLNIEHLPEIIRYVWNSLNKYSEYRRLKLILTVNISGRNVEDIKNMIESKAASAKAFNIKLLPNKPKTLYEIHHHLLKIPELIENNAPIYSKFAELLDGYSRENISIKFPTDEVELIKIGIDLNICVGSEYYRTKAINGDSQIFMLYDRSKLVACVEVKDYQNFISLEQISAEENKTVSQKYVDWILETFKDKFPNRLLSHNHFPEEDF